MPRPECWKDTGNFCFEFTADSHTLWTWPEILLLDAWNGWLNYSKTYVSNWHRYYTCFEFSTHEDLNDLSMDFSILDVALTTANFKPGGLTYFFARKHGKVVIQFSGSQLLRDARPTEVDRKGYFPKLFLNIQIRVHKVCWTYLAMSTLDGFGLAWMSLKWSSFTYFHEESSLSSIITCTGTENGEWSGWQHTHLYLCILYPHEVH